MSGASASHIISEVVSASRWGTHGRRMSDVARGRTASAIKAAEMFHASSSKSFSNVAPVTRWHEGNVKPLCDPAKESTAESLLPNSTPSPVTQAIVLALDDTREFDDTLSILLREVEHRQARLNTTCHKTSIPYLLLLLTNTMQLVMVTSNAEAHTVGSSKNSTYTWYWPLGDAFHSIVGVVFVLALMASYTMMSQMAMGTIPTADSTCQTYHMSVTRRAIIMSHLTNALQGSHILGINISQEFSVMFAWGIVLSIWTTVVAILEQE